MALQIGRLPAEHTREVAGKRDEKEISIIKAIGRCIKTLGLSERKKINK